MIRYALSCARGHQFEAWFGSGADYERAAAAGENSCPFCGSTSVEKAPMAPAIGGKSRQVATANEKVTLAAPDPRQAAFREALKDFRRKLTENADYVGERFAEEARKIHYNEVEPHGIYGEATVEEAERLAEEGVTFQPMPPLPEDHN
jgi:hypothetical protein